MDVDKRASDHDQKLDAAGRLALLRPRLGPPQTVIGEPVGEIAQADFWSELGREARQAVRPAPRADAAGDPDHDERVEG